MPIGNQRHLQINAWDHSTRPVLCFHVEPIWINAIAHLSIDQRHFLVTLLHLHLHKRGGLPFAFLANLHPCKLLQSDGKLEKF